jgi:hypothetical protein
MSGRKDVLEMAGIRKKGKKNPKRGLWNYTEVNRVKVNMERTGESPQIGWIIRGGTFFGGGAHTGLSLHLSPHVHNEEGRLLSYSLFFFLFFFFLELHNCVRTLRVKTLWRETNNRGTVASEMFSRERERVEKVRKLVIQEPVKATRFLPFSSFFLYPNVGCFVRCTRTKRLLLFVFFAIVHQ